MLEIALLGDQRCSVDGEVLATLVARRSLQVLAYLALRPGQPQPRPQVASALWPDSTSGQSLTNLRRELHTLRAALGPHAAALSIDSRTVSWVPAADDRCDVSEFVSETAATDAAWAAHDEQGVLHHGARAVAAYGGALLPVSTDEWVLAERDTLHRDCVRVLDHLIALEADVEVGRALGHAERRLALEPLEELSYQALMRLQARAGDRAAALRTYHRCVSVLDGELGVAPDAKTTAVYQELVSARSLDTASGEHQISTSTRPPLVGRTHDIDLVLDHWQNACQGSTGVHLVSGEAGVGKSRLLEEVAARVAATGAIAVTARCYSGHGRVPLGPVVSWLGSAAMRGERGELAQEWQAEVDRLLPVTTGDRAQPRPMVDAWQRHHFFEGLSHAVMHSGRPTLLVLDDMQWCDPETLTWLTVFLTMAQGYPAMILAAARDEQLLDHPALALVLAELRTSAQLSETSLVPLTSDLTSELAESVLGSSLTVEEAAMWQGATGGSPLFVIEWARSHTGTEPRTRELGQLPRVHAVLMGRLQQLSEPGLQTARLAAAIGRDFDVELLEEASDLSSEAVVDAVDELWRRRIIQGRTATTYDFSHDLLRDAAYELTSPPLRPLLHRRIAQALELRHGDSGSVAIELAEQYDRANAPKRAIRAYASAAEEATRVFANQDAVRHYQRGLELLKGLAAGRERDETELALCAALSPPLTAHEGYASPRLRGILERSAHLAERLDDERLQLQSLVGLFAVRYVQGDIAESYRIAERALELGSAHPDVVGQAHFALGGAATSLGRHEQGVEHLAAAHELSLPHPPALVGTRPEVHARAWSAHPLWLLGRDDEALRWSTWAIERAEAVGHPYSVAVALSYAAITHQLRRDADATAEFAARSRELCTRHGFAYYREWSSVLGGWSLGGHAGIDQMEQGLRALRLQGALARQPYYMGLFAEKLLDLGQAERAHAVLDGALAAAAEHQDRWWLPELHRLKAQLVEGDAAVRHSSLAREIAVEHGSVALLRRLEAGSPADER